MRWIAVLLLPAVRLLRYAYVDGAMVQGELVREGHVYARQPGVRYLKDMAALERRG